MARRTKAQIRAEKIAAIEARRREEEALLRELKREAAEEEKAAFDAAAADLVRWLLGGTEARSLEQVAVLREVLGNAKTLQSIRDKVAAVASVQDASTADAAPVGGGAFDDDEPAASSSDGDAGGDTEGSTEADPSEQREDGDDEERSSFKPW